MLAAGGTVEGFWSPWVMLGVLLGECWDPWIFPNQLPNHPAFKLSDSNKLLRRQFSVFVKTRCFASQQGLYNKAVRHDTRHETTKSTVLA